MRLRRLRRRRARGVVAFLELAEDGGIAKFSHIVSSVIVKTKFSPRTIPKKGQKNPNKNRVF